MNRTSVLAATIMVLLLLGQAVAQEDDYEYEEARDILELSIYGGLAVPMGDVKDWQTGFGLPDNEEIIDRAPNAGWDLGIDLGYFVSNNILVGLNFVYTEWTIDTEEETKHKHRLFNPNLYVKYNFEGESNFVPYVKGSIGLQNAKFSSYVWNPEGRRFRELSYDPALAFGLNAGLFYYTADYSGIFLEAGYAMALTDEVEGTYKDVNYPFAGNINTVQINAGVRLLVGSGE